MKYYTEIVPFEISKKLASAGYEQKDYGSIYTEDGTYIGCAAPSPVRSMTYSAPTYAEVFDWLMERKTNISIGEVFHDNKVWFISSILSPLYDINFGYRKTFFEVANSAISKALEILNYER